MEINQAKNIPLSINQCCENTLDTLTKKSLKPLFKKMLHNWKTRSRLHTLSESQMKDIGLTSVDIYNETNKPLWK
ncbi:hypothetical protein MUS1_05860 [Marinomonas ushuaiensis DSM 15871]|uniref:DUF1127 domain-containing protein n=1 Tax=Marinomonas ushuaiensis DSM 15871 TaxID=1122207 RepID=X7E3M5_9GAMM|nr:hypothetical protein [Marinomonas ushuaiensis]ETX09771.1 hypothetical protein MUS1_05860 [Marinomonas ushuaiensis DSM 15871]